MVAAWILAFLVLFALVSPLLSPYSINDKDKLYIIYGNIAFEATLDAHSLVGRVPNIHIQIEDYSEETFGSLVIFFERAVAISGYLLEINPFNQPGVEVYKSNMFKTLKKPM